MFTDWHGLFSLVLTFPGLRIEAPPLSTVQGKCIYKTFKAENHKTQLLELYTSVFIFPRLIVQRPIHRPLMLSMYYSSTDLSAICGTIVESSGPIFRSSVSSIQVFGPIFQPTAVKGLNIVGFETETKASTGVPLKQILTQNTIKKIWDPILAILCVTFCHILMVKLIFIYPW